MPLRTFSLLSCKNGRRPRKNEVPSQKFKVPSQKTETAYRKFYKASRTSSNRVLYFEAPHRHRTPYGVHSDAVRCTIRRRPLSDRTPCGVRWRHGGEKRKKRREK